MSVKAAHLHLADVTMKRGFSLRQVIHIQIPENHLFDIRQNLEPYAEFDGFVIELCGGIGDVCSEFLARFLVHERQRQRSFSFPALVLATAPCSRMMDNGFDPMNFLCAVSRDI